MRTVLLPLCYLLVAGWDHRELSEKDDSSSEPVTLADLTTDTDKPNIDIPEDINQFIFFNPHPHHHQHHQHHHQPPPLGIFAAEGASPDEPARSLVIDVAKVDVFVQNHYLIVPIIDEPLSEDSIDSDSGSDDSAAAPERQMRASHHGSSHHPCGHQMSHSMEGHAESMGAHSDCNADHAANADRAAANSHSLSSYRHNHNHHHENHTTTEVEVKMDCKDECPMHAKGGCKEGKCRMHNMMRGSRKEENEDEKAIKKDGKQMRGIAIPPLISLDEAPIVVSDSHFGAVDGSEGHSHPHHHHHGRKLEHVAGVISGPIKRPE